MLNHPKVTAARRHNVNTPTQLRRTAAALFSITCLAALALQVQPALAQDAVEDTADSEGIALEESFVLEKVIVTARRIEEVASTVPLTIRVISEDEIILQGVNNLEDVARLTPGLTFDIGGFPNDTRPAVRGMQSERGRPSG